MPELSSIVGVTEWLGDISDGMGVLVRVKLGRAVCVRSGVWVGVMVAVSVLVGVGVAVCEGVMVGVGEMVSSAARVFASSLNGTGLLTKAIASASRP